MSNPVVFQWLERIGLGYAVPHFQAEGIVTPQQLASLEIADGVADFIVTAEDKKRLWELIHRIRDAANKKRVPESSQSSRPAPPAESSPSRPVNVSHRSHTVEEESSSFSRQPVVDDRAYRGQSRQSVSHSSNENNRRKSYSDNYNAAKEADEDEDDHDDTYGNDYTEDDEVRESRRPHALPGSQSASASRSQAGFDRDGFEVKKPKPKMQLMPSAAAAMKKRESSNTNSNSVPTSSSNNSGSRRPITANGPSGVPGGRPSIAPSSSNQPSSSAAVNSSRNVRPQTAQSQLAPVISPSMGNPSFGLSGTLDMSTPRIRVVVRKRPLNRRELNARELDVIRINARRTLEVHELRKKVDLTKFTEIHSFAFDEVFNETVSTEDIYRHTAQRLIGSIFRGGRATCFAYGQTGSGKTHTMMGNYKEGMDVDIMVRSNPGLYVLAARDIFAMLRAWEQRQDDSSASGSARFPRRGSRRLAIVVSFFEIYGGRLFDLLNNREEIKALQDARGDVNLMGLSEQRVSGVESLLKLIDYGNSVRSTGSTGANADSSRSHAVLQITLAEALADGKGGLDLVMDPATRHARPVGKFSFIDLAGSERGADTNQNDKKTRLEGAEINKSLLALKECIRSLYQSADYNPFRGSKLTQVLKDSFVGDSSTVMIATISPNQTNTEHTLNTLRYAYRVKEISHDEEDAAVEPPHGYVKNENDIHSNQGNQHSSDSNENHDDLDEIHDEEAVENEVYEESGVSSFLAKQGEPVRAPVPAAASKLGINSNSNSNSRSENAPRESIAPRVSRLQPPSVPTSSSSSGNAVGKSGIPARPSLRVVKKPTQPTATAPSTSGLRRPAATANTVSGSRSTQVSDLNIEEDIQQMQRGVETSGGSGGNRRAPLPLSEDDDEDDRHTRRSGAVDTKWNSPNRSLNGSVQSRVNRSYSSSKNAQLASQLSTSDIEHDNDNDHENDHDQDHDESGLIIRDTDVTGSIGQHIDTDLGEDIDLEEIEGIDREQEERVYKNNNSNNQGNSRYANSQLSESLIVRDRERKARMAAVAAGLRGLPLNDDEVHLISWHCEQLDEMSQLIEQDRQLMTRGSGTVLESLGSPAGTLQVNLSRGDMAQYVQNLEDVLNRKFVLITDMLRTCEVYREKFGRAVGLVDPMEGHEIR